MKQQGKGKATSAKGALLLYSLLSLLSAFCSLISAMLSLPCAHCSLLASLLLPYGTEIYHCPIVALKCNRAYPLLSYLPSLTLIISLAQAPKRSRCSFREAAPRARLLAALCSLLSALCSLFSALCSLLSALWSLSLLAPKHHI
jgi:hypothetical protein